MTKQIFFWKLYIPAAFPRKEWNLSVSLLTSCSPMWPPGNYRGSRGILERRKPPSLCADWLARANTWRFLSTVKSWLVRRTSVGHHRPTYPKPPPRSWTSWTTMIGSAVGGSALWLDGVRLTKRQAGGDSNWLYYTKKDSTIRPKQPKNIHNTNTTLITLIIHFFITSHEAGRIFTCSATRSCISYWYWEDDNSVERSSASILWLACNRLTVSSSTAVCTDHMCTHFSHYKPTSTTNDLKLCFYYNSQIE